MQGNEMSDQPENAEAMEESISEQATSNDAESVALNGNHISTQVNEDEFPPFESDCDLCNKKFSNYDIYSVHVNAYSHKSYRALMEEKERTKAGEPADEGCVESVDGEIGKKRKIEFEVIASSSKTTKYTQTRKPSEFPPFERNCKFCDKRFNNYKHYFVHINTVLHKKRSGMWEKDKMKDVEKAKYEWQLESVDGKIVRKRKFNPDNGEGSAVGSSSKKSEADEGSNARKEEYFKKPIQLALECKLCQKMFVSRNVYTDHMESPGHKRRASVKQVHCWVCDKWIVGEKHYEGHLKGKQHKKALKIQELDQKFKSEEIQRKIKSQGLEKIDPEEVDPDQPKLNRDGSKYQMFSYRCKICNQKFPGLIDLDRHMSSAGHIRNVEAAVAEKASFCHICNSSFSGVGTYEAHIATAEHIRNSQIKRLQGGANFESYYPSANGYI